MVTNADNTTEFSQELVDQSVNSNNSYEKLKQQVDNLKNEYEKEFGKNFDYFLFIDNSNHHLLEKHGEIIRLIKSNSDLDREEALYSAKSVHSNVSGTISISSELTNSILETKKIA